MPNPKLPRRDSITVSTLPGMNLKPVNQIIYLLDPCQALMKSNCKTQPAFFAQSKFPVSAPWSVQSPQFDAVLPRGETDFCPNKRLQFPISPRFFFNSTGSRRGDARRPCGPERPANRAQIPVEPPCPLLPRRLGWGSASPARILAQQFSPSRCQTSNIPFSRLGSEMHQSWTGRDAQTRGV